MSRNQDPGPTQAPTPVATATCTVAARAASSPTLRRTTRWCRARRLADIERAARRTTAVSETIMTRVSPSGITATWMPTRSCGTPWAVSQSFPAPTSTSVNPLRPVLIHAGVMRPASTAHCPTSTNSTPTIVVTGQGHRTESGSWADVVDDDTARSTRGSRRGSEPER